MPLAPSHTFVFADLVGFTALAQESGDEVAADTALRFCAAATAVAREHGVQIVKHVGDRVMLHADRADAAIAAGLSLVCETPHRNGLPPVRAGAATGTAVPRGDDWFGSAVNLAARVTAVARGGELLVTSAVATAAGGVGLHLHDLGLQELRHFRVPIHLLAPRPA